MSECSETTERQFPIMDGKQRSGIPWRVIAPHEAQAQRNHGQSLARLAERGGLCWSEAWGVLTGVGWSRLPRGQEDRCKAAVLAICQRQTLFHNSASPTPSTAPPPS